MLDENSRWGSSSEGAPRHCFFKALLHWRPVGAQVAAIAAPSPIKHSHGTAESSIKAACLHLGMTRMCTACDTVPDRQHAVAPSLRRPTLTECYMII
ncbi:hypothetical protein ACRE_004510 [Hapsidospora chrysogenum ATCC 11550]|uniref:Uncharacterized protein n=1 Tax=Hapsidospora chrysogenum (strain ATCC 11550 / CBS 779.69 / DSM 880 / IAM 14645 / JCM 23072 / IMI 49137) TaxID=857340 RepID=A0A086TH45_HAPC1|nr:hypothetical protein ACRE_004510 [Hapsidospora chrysogenum ATCC 11550]